MHQLAIRDELTGLYNRREMRRLLDEAAERYRGLEQPTALLMLDIDHFKLVNDNYGHKAGDSVLQWLSEFLAESIHLPHWLARYGGEELAIILPNSDEKAAFEVAEQIRREIEANPYNVTQGKGKPLKIELTASFGVAAYSGAIDSEESLIAAADLALYEAKRRGRNCVVLYDSETLKTTAFLTTQVLQGPESAEVDGN